jgi:hypothetical protein
MGVLQLEISIAEEPGFRREVVTGYCDLDETRAGKYPALALRRADAVKAALVHLGMKGDLIEVATAEDVMDPADQRFNRRVAVAPVFKNNPRTASGRQRDGQGPFDPFRR